MREEEGGESESGCQSSLVSCGIHVVDLGVTFACRLPLVVGNNHIAHVERFEGFLGCYFSDFYPGRVYKYFWPS